MAGENRPLRAVARIVLAAIAATAMAGLAACGSAVAGGGSATAAGHGHSQQTGAESKASSGSAVCQQASRLSQVQVSRVSGLSTGTFHEVLPAGIAIRNPAKTRALATALCALPPMPARMNCPADFGGRMRLGFATANQGFPPVTVHLTGCRTVTGLGPVRSWSRTPAIGRELARLSGMKITFFGKNGSIPTP